MPANFVAPLSIPEDENWVTSQCPEFYAEDALMLSQVIYLGLLWLGLIVLLNPGVTIGKFTKKYLKPHWWLIINSMWIWKRHHIIQLFPSQYPFPYHCHTRQLRQPRQGKSLGRALSKPSSPHTTPDLPNNEYHPKDMDQCPMIQVPSEDLVLYAIARHPNKLMSYPF
ncbi:hypothetical protein DSO57_1023134 [Entomophthora muscae]|uniref:Uncharacterized protein n=1 Tax=Entomophthora muscae TaxID=34485 RepID=A0ACC2UPE3_9FUNG|nr:hypothetical protein DSO57_1023134 [Entomophthora muscae]